MKIWTFKENKLTNSNNNIPQDNLNNYGNICEQHENDNQNEIRDPLNDPNDNTNKKNTEKTSEKIIKCPTNVENSKVINNELGKKIKLLKIYKETIQTYTEKKDEDKDETVNFNDIPEFENRKTSDGYSFESYLKNGQIPDSTIRTLINKFINQRFTELSDLNNRTSSLERTDGFYRWDVKSVAIHLETEQVTKVLKDKYGYSYASGKAEDIPLSFYFDMSGSMSYYSHILSVIALELIKKDVKILVGYNSTIGIQIDGVTSNVSVEELKNMITHTYNKSVMNKVDGFDIQLINKDLDEYLREHNAKKCVAFSDNDTLSTIIKLSEFVDTYYLYFQNYVILDSIKKFRGFFYQIRDIQDLINCLIKITKDKYNEVTYIKSEKILNKERR